MLTISMFCLCFRILCWPCCADKHYSGLYDGEGIARVPVQPHSEREVNLRAARARSKEELDRRLHDLMNSGQTFRDNFDRKSQISVAASTQGSATTDDISWVRAHEFMKETPTLFGADGPQPLDVGQGRIGDCYFLAAIAALAERPLKIKELFVNEEANSAGLYGVLMAKHGRWITLWLDDCFATMNGKPRYCNSKDTSKLWPLLLEKAYAVLYGDGAYEKIEGGLPAYSFHALTMCPTLRFDIRDYSTAELWQVLRSASQGGCVLSASCQSKPLFGLCCPPCFRLGRRKWRSILVGHACCESMWLFMETLLDCLSNFVRWLIGPLKCLCGIPIALFMCIPCALFRGKEGLRRLVDVLFGDAGMSGMVKGHAYSVLDTAEVTTRIGTTAQLVKLRNPWGQTEWAGLYSDGSCAWTDEAEMQVGLERDNDGAFWMLLADFISYLNVVGVCYLAPGVYSTLDKRQRDGELEKQPLVDRLWHDVDCEDNALTKIYQGPGEWRVTASTLTFNSGMEEAGVAIQVPWKCQLFVTVDDVETRGHDGSRSDGGSWAVLVFDEHSELVGKNLVKPRILALGCVDMLSGRDRQFADLASISTTKMVLGPGTYTVAVRFPEPVNSPTRVALLTHATCEVRLLDIPPNLQASLKAGADDEESRDSTQSGGKAYGRTDTFDLEDGDDDDERNWLVSDAKMPSLLRFDSRNILSRFGYGD
eukprot:CAMPEP_0178439830 /NCGR_PEP_ID=MMETSP0689_2-20121128/36398_1 /TAXON_ID=160604 /ORGANISM="Amphidinium massartii, Strain CS-259" /LENGTH=706 /DNA_ID=CAMNT_0020062451 /DNA_START=141 /DNA_END=2261 /DNA_ORIENTATION=-